MFSLQLKSQKKKTKLFDICLGKINRVKGKETNVASGVMDAFIVLSNGGQSGMF